jgi:hypothetical protein
MEIPGKGSIETMWGERLCNGTVNKLGPQYNVKNLHWILVKIAGTDHTLNIGDSLPQVMHKALPVIPDIQSILTTWLKYYLPKVSWCTKLRGIKVPLQLDKSSCEIVSPSTIHHLVPAAPLWDPKKPGKLCAYNFCQCMELGKGVSSIVIQLNSVMTLTFLQVTTRIREFWDDDSKAEVGAVLIRPSTTADPELMVNLVPSDNMSQMGDPLPSSVCSKVWSSLNTPSQWITHKAGKEWVVNRGNAMMAGVYSRLPKKTDLPFSASTLRPDSVSITGVHQSHTISTWFYWCGNQNIYNK